MKRTRTIPASIARGLYNTVTACANGETLRAAFLPRLPDATVLAVRRSGEPWLGTHTAQLVRYTHALDMETAQATRTPLLRFADSTTQIVESRFVSAAHPSVFVIRWRVTACDWSGLLDIADGTDGDVRNAIVERQRAFDGRHIVDVMHAMQPDGVLLTSARLSGAQVSIAIGSRVDVQCASEEIGPCVEWKAGAACFTRRTVYLHAGETICVDKIVSVHTSRDALAPDPTDAALASVRRAGNADSLYDAHLRSWQPTSDGVRADGDGERLVRQLNLRAFHVLQTVSAHSALEDAGIPARGWHEGYHGHVFWDDLFVLPVVTRDEPDHARGPLLYRYRRLDVARSAARAADLEGAMYPWRSAATGDEETPRLQFNPLDGHWMHDHTRLERHVGSSIAWNIWRHWGASADDGFFRDRGAEMIIEIARFWASAAAFDEQSGRYAIDGVIGPDEYHDLSPQTPWPGLRNNAYTNVMAMWTLRCAHKALASLVERDRAALARKIALRDDEPRRWLDVARNLAVPFVDDGVIEQFEGFARLRRTADPKGLTDDGARVDWSLERSGDTVNAWQVAKQPDVVMLFHLLGETNLRALLAQAGYAFDAAAARRTLEYYLARMTHESSLSQVGCAGALARGQPERSWQYFSNALTTDVTPREGSAHEGLHLGALAGALDVVVRHYGGVDFEDGVLQFDPAWPRELPRTRLSLMFRHQQLQLEGSTQAVALRATRDNTQGVAVAARGQRFLLEPGAVLTIRAGSGAVAIT
ncbi:glycosyl hydrolase family 65 protein [Paraburkholderia phymatum]|uniref:glycosyl hydrolase family 65 protein n=1 Tax=Paraburkholderia phymatum TaxID=148447 RepID=UPI003175C49C